MSARLMPLKVGLLLILLSHCGLTRAGNPGDGKKGVAGQPQSGIVAVPLDKVFQQRVRTSKVTLTPITGFGESLVKEFDQTPNEVIFSDVPKGTYKLSLVGDEDTIKFDSVQVAGNDQLQKYQSACNRRDEIFQLPVHEVTTGLPPEKLSGTLHVITAQFSGSSVCDDDILPEPPKEGGTANPEPLTPRTKGFIEVQVAEANTLLMLAAAEPLTWAIKIKDGGSLTAVVLSGKESRITGVPGEVSVYGLFTSPAIEYMAKYAQSYESKIDLERKDYVCTDKPKPLLGFNNYQCATAAEITAGEIADGHFDRQMQHIETLLGQKPKSVQSQSEAVEFFVLPEISGLFVPEERAIGECYQQADNRILEHWPGGERDEQGKPTGEICFDQGDCVSPGSLDPELTDAELEELSKGPQCD